MQIKTSKSNVLAIIKMMACTHTSTTLSEFDRPTYYFVISFEREIFSDCQNI